jgi:hypothetical protein
MHRHTNLCDTGEAFGVSGTTASPQGAGVNGFALRANGVNGTSTRSDGVVGVTEGGASVRPEGQHIRAPKQPIAFGRNRPEVKPIDADRFQDVADMPVEREPGAQWHRATGQPVAWQLPSVGRRQS